MGKRRRRKRRPGDAPKPSKKKTPKKTSKKSLDKPEWMEQEIQGKYSDLLSLWSIQESLLQTYRTYLIAVQAFLTAIAIFLFDRKHKTGGYESLTILAIFGSFIILCLAIVILNREKVVRVCQDWVMEIERKELNESRKFLTYLKGVQIIVNTRWFMKPLPWLFFASWILLLIYILIVPS